HAGGVGEDGSAAVAHVGEGRELVRRHAVRRLGARAGAGSMAGRLRSGMSVRNGAGRLYFFPPAADPGAAGSCAFTAAPSAIPAGRTVAMRSEGASPLSTSM